MAKGNSSLKKYFYTNVEKVDRNKLMTQYIKGKQDGQKHTFRDASKKFHVNVASVYRIYKRYENIV